MDLKTVTAVVSTMLGAGGIVYGVGANSGKDEVRAELKTHVDVEEMKHQAMKESLEEVKSDVKAIRKAVEE